jgi:Uma2 family endonuclease
MNLIDRNPDFSRRFQPTPPNHPVDRETFRRWVGRTDGRYEWVDGQITMMVDVSRNHAKITTRFVVALHLALDQERYQVSSAEFGVRTPRGIRFPDVVIDPAERDGREHGTDSPIFIAEVLSPSSLSIDTVEKPAEYGAIGSLVRYAVLSQDEPRVLVWARDPIGWPAEPRTIVGREASLDLPELGFSIPLRELYRGIGSPDA